uniref:Tropomodulin n=1 Tax=Wuchereria bancrofti TaxID=6293 RepID=A0A1I8ECS4_WUCBA
MTMSQRNDMMTDADLMDAIQALGEQEQNDEVKELLKMMSDNRIISWEEAEQIMGCSTYKGPIKSSLPPQTRPMEPDNDTDVDWSIQQLQMDDPKLKQRTPIPQLKRLLSAIKNNTHLEKIALANMEQLYALQPIFDVVASNTTLKSINLETNYLSGDFFARLFKAALVNQTLEEVKAVNQGVTFATAAEKEIIDAVFQNRGLTKVSINLRLPEGRHKIENALIRNQEIRRVLRRQAAAAAEVEAQKRTEEVNKPVVIKPEMQSGKLQPMKPAILGSAFQVPFAKKQPPRIVGNSGNDSIDATGNLGKAPLTEKNNKLLAKTTEPVESFSRVDPVKITTSKKTGIKRASTKTKMIDTNVNETFGKTKSKKTVPKISLEQAIPEIELSTEEVLRKTCLPRKSSSAVRESSAPFGTNETDATISADSTLSRWQNNPCDNLMKSNNAIVPGEEADFTVPVRNSNQHFDKKPAGLVNSIRNSSLVPPVFLVAEQKIGPVKRNFSIPSKRNSTEQEKITAKLDELKKSSLRSTPFNPPMPDIMIEWRKQRKVTVSPSEIGQRPLYDSRTNLNEYQPSAEPAFFTNESVICCKHGRKCKEYYTRKFDKKKISSLWPISELLDWVGQAPNLKTSNRESLLQQKPLHKNNASQMFPKNASKLKVLYSFYLGQRSRSASIPLTEIPQNFGLYHEVKS